MFGCFRTFLISLIAILPPHFVSLAWSEPPTGQPFFVEWIDTANDVAINDVHFGDARRGWAVGAGGRILATRDGGINWDLQPTGTDKSLESGLC
jgi:hypothetical protein